MAGWSPVTSAVFYINTSSTLEAPVISPNGGSFTTAQTVTIGDIDGTAYYTTDGSNPETSSTRTAYTGAFTVYQSETIQAVNYSSAGWSTVASAYFTISGSSTLEAPVISPNGGSFTTAQTVTIGDIDGTAYYTTDGSNPETSSTRTAYTGAFTVYQSETIQAVNYSSAGWSTVASAYFTISGSSTLEAPVISPDGGSFTTAQTVTIGDIDGTAYYTTDGSNPETSSTRTAYTGAFTVYQSETIQAVNYSSAGWSTVASAYFTISGSSTLEAPVISPNGGSFTTAQTVTIGDIDGTAYYTTDGSNPETSSTRTAYTGAFTVYQSETIQAVNYSSAGWSTVASAYFTISGSSTLEAPVISPNGGSFTTAQTVTIGDIPAGDTAYYTTDGSDPVTSSTRITYTEAFTVYQSETVEAAFQDPISGWSSVASAYFTISGSSITPTPGSNSAQITQLEQQMETDINNGQMGQAMQILQQIQQLEEQNTDETNLSNLEQQLINDINNGKWGQAEAVMKRIIRIEASADSEGSGWAYSQLGQIFQQQGNNSVNVFNNGSQVNFDVQPIIVNGRTLIPIRAIANSLGISNNGINWDNNGTVTINNGSSQIVFNNNAQQASLNGTSYSLDVPAQIINGRMMVPLRAVSQMFHKNVQWYPNGRIVSIQ